MTLRVAVDFGTSSTCVAMSRDGGVPQLVAIDGHPLVSSAVYGSADGTLFVGQEAERQAAIDPSRFEPHPKRRIDEGELLLGSSVVPVLDVVRAVLRRAVNEARRLAGGAAVDLLVLTHPADWGAVRSRVLRQAGRDFAREQRVLPEPVAAAVFHSANHALPDGSLLAVLDVGGGTVDASLVKRDVGAAGNGPGSGGAPGGFRVLATRGDPHFGGADVDQILLSHIGSEVSPSDAQQWRRLTQGRELADRRSRRVLRADVRSAKETLSRHTYTDVPLPSPFRDVHLTRKDLERLVADPLGRTTELITSCAAEAGVTPRQLSAIFLVGGSSRIPLVARLVQQRTGIIPSTLDAPETVVARGALLAVTTEPGRAGGRPAQPGGPAYPARASAASAGAVVPRRAPPRQQGPGPGPSNAGAVPQGHRPPGPAPATSAGGQGVTVPVDARGTRKRDSSRRFSPRTMWLGAVSGVVVLAGVGVALWLWLGSGGEGPPEPDVGKRIAQYDYSFGVPTGWHQTGDAGSGRRKVQIAPEHGTGESGGGTPSITVQEFVLSDGDRGRNVKELRQALADHGGFTGVDTGANFAGRQVVRYHQAVTRGTIDWYVLFRGTVQVSVGCAHGGGDQERTRAACEHVVGSMTMSG